MPDFSVSPRTTKQTSTYSTEEAPVSQAAAGGVSFADRVRGTMLKAATWFFERILPIRLDDEGFLIEDDNTESIRASIRSLSLSSFNEFESDYDELNSALLNELLEQEALLLKTIDFLEGERDEKLDEKGKIELKSNKYDRKQDDYLQQIADAPDSDEQAKLYALKAGHWRYSIDIDAVNAEIEGVEQSIELAQDKLMEVQASIQLELRQARRANAYCFPASEQ